MFLFINDSRTCKSAHNHGKSNREEHHGGRGMTENLFTKIKYLKTFLTLKEKLLLQNFRYERIGIIT